MLVRREKMEINKILKLGTHFTVKFNPMNGLFGHIEIRRENQFRTQLILTQEDIRELQLHLGWLSGQMLVHEKIEHDNPVGSEYYSGNHGDEEC